MGDGDEGASMEVPSACMCWCACVPRRTVLYVCDGAPSVPTFGMVTTRWPVVWDLLAVLTSGETSSDKAS